LPAWLNPAAAAASLLVQLPGQRLLVCWQREAQGLGEKGWHQWQKQQQQLQRMLLSGLLAYTAHPGVADAAAAVLCFWQAAWQVLQAPAQLQYAAAAGVMHTTFHLG
jgi:hypothetical protein